MWAGAANIHGKYIVQNGNEVGYKHIIRYNDGITAEHVIASASVPINYSYMTLEVESYNDNTANYEKNIRHFWDGGIMSNTYDNNRQLRTSVTFVIAVTTVTVMLTALTADTTRCRRFRIWKRQVINSWHWMR
jgi:predicted acylesterase/phospholipase RssA